MNRNQDEKCNKNFDISHLEDSKSVNFLIDHFRMLHWKVDDFQQHCSSIGQYLCELRVNRDLGTADVEIICAQMQTDFLHSSIGAVHSNYIRAVCDLFKFWIEWPSEFTWDAD